MIYLLSGGVPKMFGMGGGLELDGAPSQKYLSRYAVCMTLLKHACYRTGPTQVVASLSGCYWNKLNFFTIVKYSLHARGNYLGPVLQLTFW